MTNELAIRILTGDVLGTTEQTQEAVTMAVKALSQPEPQWIPCSEELPEEDHLTGAGVQYSDYVLMTVFNEEDDETVIDYGYLRDGEWYSVNADIIIPNWWKVTAWMPLPEPYKEET